MQFGHLTSLGEQAMAGGFGTAKNAMNADGPENLQQNLHGVDYGSGDDEGLDAVEQQEIAEEAVSSGSAEIDAGLLAPAVATTQNEDEQPRQHMVSGYEQLAGSGEEAEQEERLGHRYAEQVALGQPGGDASVSHSPEAPVDAAAYGLTFNGQSQQITGKVHN